MKNATGRLTLLVTLTIASACNSGFVDGWRDDQDGPQGTPEEQCGRRDNHSWVGGECKENGSFSLADIKNADDCNKIENTGWFSGACKAYEDLTESECVDVHGRSWTWRKTRDGQEHCIAPEHAACEAQAGYVYVKEGKRCVAEPTLTAASSTYRVALQGEAMEPIEFVKSSNTLVSIIDTSCPDYFGIFTNKIVTKDPKAAPKGHVTCKASFVATSSLAASKPLTVQVTIRPGFAALCEGEPSAGQELTINLLRELIAPDEECPAAAEALAKRKSLFKGLRLEDTGEDALITDVSPLFGLKALTEIRLTGQRKLMDVSALAYLPALRRGDLSGIGLDRKKSAKTEANCPTGEGANEFIRKFCKDR